MTGVLKAELFPDDCVVVEMPLHNQWIYLIHKNGNSTLRIVAENNGHRILRNHELQQLDTIDVYIRNPRSRYISGVNTYLQHLARDYPELDQDTAFWFAKRYKFLNRHYLPQFYWLQNLSRFTRADTQLRFRNFETIGTVLDVDYGAGVESPTKDFAKRLLSNDTDLEFWLYLDQILLDLSGQSMSWPELKNHYRINHPEIAQHVLPQA